MSAQAPEIIGENAPLGCTARKLPPLELRGDARLDVAIAAARASMSAMPAIVTGLDVLRMGRPAWERILKSGGHWVALYNADASINLEHPDVKRALQAYDAARHD